MKKGSIIPWGGGDERGDYGLEEKLLLGDLEGMMKQFWDVNYVCAIYSSDAATLYNAGETKASGGVGDISTSSGGVVDPRETSARNGGVLLLSAEDTDSHIWLVSIHLKYIPPHSQKLHDNTNVSMQVFLYKV